MKTKEAKKDQSKCLNVESNELAINQRATSFDVEEMSNEEQLRIWLRKMDRYQFDIDYDLIDMNY